MSTISKAYETDAARLVEGAAMRVAPGARAIAVEPDRRSRLVFLTEPAGLAVEQYKLLRRRLEAPHPRGGVILVTSPGPGEGKTLTSINLAWCLADAGHHTCLVDLDFRAPGIAPALGYAFEQDNVEEVLAGRRTITQSARQIGNLPLYVLGVGQRLASPAQLFTAPSLGMLVSDLRAAFRWVILDMAPAIPMSDVAEVVPHVDGALMVVRAGKTKKAMVAPPFEILGSKLWGVVLNDAPVVGSSYYGYYGDRKA